MTFGSVDRATPHDISRPRATNVLQMGLFEPSLRDAPKTPPRLDFGTFGLLLGHSAGLAEVVATLRAANRTALVSSVITSADSGIGDPRPGVRVEDGP